MKRSTWIYLLLCIAMMGPLAVNAKFRSDTLYLSFEKSDAMSYSREKFAFNLSKSYEKHVLKVRYADSSVFALSSYNDSHWTIDSSIFVPGDKATSIYWYRFKIRALPQDVGQPFVLMLDGEGAFELYISGTLKASAGVFPDSAGKKAKYQYFNSNPVLISFSDTGTYQVALRYRSSVAVNDGTESWFRLYTADAGSYFRNQEAGSIVTGVLLMGIGSVFLALFMVHFLFFIFYKKEKANIFFAIFTLSVALVLYASYAYYHADSMFFDDTYILVINFVPIISCFSLSAFTTFIFSKNKTVFRVIIGLSILALLLALLDHYSVIGFSSIVIWILLTLSVLYTVVMVIRSIIQRQPGSLVLGGGVLYFCIFLFFLVIYGIVNKGIRFNNTMVLLSITAIFSIPISISAYLAWRFSTTSKSLGEQLKNVETLSLEKQQLLQVQNERLEELVLARTEELQDEKQKSDELLLNILPQSVAEELKQRGAAKAQYHEQVSVLFTDFVNFTQISERLGVEELVDELNINFTAFDGIMERYGLEKIKTIGDAYLAVSGLPVPDNRHAQNAVKAALEILAFVEHRKTVVPYGLDIRIGINSGTVIAGIIGVKKFAYDIWGDTVNIAARMEQTSMPGKINISATSYVLVKDEFDCVHRGRIDAKHKGEMDMYFVNGKR